MTSTMMQMANPPNAPPRWDHISYHIVFMVAATSLIAARFGTRTKQRIGLWWDDWFALITYILCMTYWSLGIWTWSHRVLGVPPQYVTIPRLIKVLKISVVLIIDYQSVMSFARYSILCLYYRIFKTDKVFLLACKIIFAMSIMWHLGTVFSTAFRCSPPEAQWDPLLFLSDACYDGKKWFLANEIPNCFLDFAIVILPIMSINKLQLSLKRKLLLMIIFALGSLIGVISIIRMVEIRNLDYVSFLIAGESWLTGQIFVALLCICLPTLGPLISNINLGQSFRRLYTYVTGSSANSKRDQTPFGGSSGPSKKRGGTPGGFNSTDSRSSQSGLTDSEGYEPARGEGKNIPLSSYATYSERNIHVRHDVEVAHAF